MALIILLGLLICVATTLVGVVTLPILIRRKSIQIPLLLLVAAVGPAAATSFWIEEPWFATSGDWRWLRLILLFSWVPALLELERRGRFIYASLPAKWIFRGALSSLLLGLSVWAAAKTEGWGLIQSHVNWNTWCWLAESNGEDGYLFTRVGNGPLRSEKLLDSVGSPAIYSYSIRWVGNQIELRSSEDSVVERYDPATRISEHESQSGDRYRFDHASRVNEIWNPKTKAWGRVPSSAERKKDRVPVSTKNSSSLDIKESFRRT